MSSIPDNAFTMLTFIAAPAVLTNASSVLALGTSNRFARAVDRSRALAAQLTTERDAKHDEVYDILMRQFERSQTRTMLLLHAMRCFYTALGSYATSALISLVGAGLSFSSHHVLYTITVVIGLVAGLLGVGGMVWGCSILLHETRLALVNLGEETVLVRSRFRTALANSHDDHDD